MSPNVWTSEGAAHSNPTLKAGPQRAQHGLCEAEGAHRGREPFAHLRTRHSLKATAEHAPGDQAGIEEAGAGR